MVARTTAEGPSERLRVSIPKADESVLKWWDMQGDVSGSIRMLIRGDIERNGYTDVVFKPVAQQPRIGRPPGSSSKRDEDEDEATPAPVTPIERAPHLVETPAPVPVAVAASSGSSAIDDIIG